MNIQKKEIGLIGLGKMGTNLFFRLKSKGWNIIGYNRNEEKINSLKKHGIIKATSINDLLVKHSAPRIIFLLITAGKNIDEILFNSSFLKQLQKGDLIIDGGNSFYIDTLKRVEKFKQYGVSYFDIGFCCGPKEILKGAPILIGGDKKIFLKYKELFSDISGGNYYYSGDSGSAHFLKMIHNGVEYGMMQSIAEGFSVIKNSDYNFDLKKIATFFNKKSLIKSDLLGFLEKSFAKYSNDLNGVSSVVDQTGEGKWTVKVGKKLGASVDIIEKSVKFRNKSKHKKTFAGKILSALRGEFGGHNI